MNDQRDIELVNELLAKNAELPWLEFKTNNIEPETIGKLCSALSNSARLEGRDFGYILWGVDDTTHQIIGTNVDLNNKKVSNQEFQLWLAQHSLRAMERRSRGRVVCGRLRFANQPAGMCSKSLCSRKAICGSCVCSTHTVVLRRTS